MWNTACRPVEDGWVPLMVPLATGNVGFGVRILRFKTGFGLDVVDEHWIDARLEVAYISRRPPAAVCEIEDDTGSSDELSISVSEALDNSHPSRF